MEAAGRRQRDKGAGEVGRNRMVGWVGLRQQEEENTRPLSCTRCRYEMSKEHGVKVEWSHVRGRKN